MKRNGLAILFLASTVFASTPAVSGELIPNTGQLITPRAPRGAQFEGLNPGFSELPSYTAGQAVTSIVSPDGGTLLVLTSGYNLVRSSAGRMVPKYSTQFVFVYDITHGKPVKKQVIQIANTYSGIAFDPSGANFYVSGGVDDNLHAYALDAAGTWVEQAHSPVTLGHHGTGVGISVRPQAAGVAVSADGSKLVVANYYNDSISLLRRSERGLTVAAELDLRPGKTDPERAAGVPGGEYPFWVVIKGNDTAYVSSIRDREIVAVDIRASPVVTARIELPGQPNKMVLNASQTTLYVAQDNSDSVAIVDTQSNALIENIGVTAPKDLLPRSKSALKGNDTNSVTLSPDEAFLYVTNGAMNDVAVIRLEGAKRRAGAVVGLIPTGWYPNSVSVSRDGRYLYVVNGKSVTGANPGWCKGIGPLKDKTCRKGNEYALQLIKAGLQSFPTPDERALGRLTAQVAQNNHLDRTLARAAEKTLAFLRRHIEHVIYIVKENRTYDQVLGDLEVGNGDPALTEFPEAVTPNLHRLARNFVTLDDFFVTSEVSYDGWAWSTAALATDLVERQTSVNYARRGLSYDSEGKNRNVNVGYDRLEDRLAADPLTPTDPDVLPGTANVAAPDGPDGDEGAGFLWNGALRRGLSVRNYGFFVDLARYRLTGEQANLRIPLLVDPAASETPVAFISNAALRPFSDPYFRGFDMSFPDYYRYREFARELDEKYAEGGLPNLILLRLPHDHTGNFANAIAGVNTPELQVADNDYAVGLVIEKIAASRYRDDTLIFVVEDDAQDGADHVDSHRTTAFIAGPYVKQRAVISTSYTTLSMYRTIEDVLGMEHSNLNDALAVPMTDVFDRRQKTWSYTAVPSDILYATMLPLPPRTNAGPVPQPTHDSMYWARVTRGLDFTIEDRLDGDRFNRILWRGLMGSKPYPR